MSEEKEVSITRQLLIQYKKEFVEKTSIVSFFLIAVVICLIPAYFLPASLILTVPFILLPTFLGLIICNLSLRFKVGKSTNILAGFKAYYSRLFFGVFKVVSAFLKTLVVYLTSATIMLLILHFGYGMKNAAYADIFARAASVQTNGELQQIITELQGNSTFIFVENISLLVAFGLASYMFFHHILTHSFKAYYNLLGKYPVPGVVLNHLHRQAFLNFRKDFYKDYYGSFWPLIILYVVGYTGGAFLATLVFKQNGAQAVIISLFFGSVLSVFYLPYLFDVYQIMHPIDMMYYLKAYSEFLKMSGDMPDVKIPQKEKENLEKMIIEFEKMMEMAKADIEKQKLEKKQKHKNNKKQ